MQVSYTDLVTPEGVAEHMKASTSREDWNKKCDEVQAANGGDYPSFWYTTILASGIADETEAKW